MAADKLEGTCSVCLRLMQLRGDNPIRHGFHAVGVRHGQHSGWHTGPCPGVDFPHLGISTEGTMWALNTARGRLAKVNEAQAELATYPDFTWHPTKRGLPDFTQSFIVRRSDDDKEIEWSSLTQAQKDEHFERSRRGVPRYKHMHAHKVIELKNQADRLERAISDYEKVLSTWSPDKYPVKGAAKKVDTIHYKHDVQLKDRLVSRPYCTTLRSSRFTPASKMTTDLDKVTCQRCRKQLGLP